MCEGEKLSVSASVKNGMLTTTVVNLSPEADAQIKLEPLGGSFAGDARIQILGDGDLKAHNTFENPNRLVPVDSTIQNFDGCLTLPRGAVAAITVPVIL